jgi:hypothetical protein
MLPRIAALQPKNTYRILTLIMLPFLDFFLHLKSVRGVMRVLLCMFKIHYTLFKIWSLKNDGVIRVGTLYVRDYIFPTAIAVVYIWVRKRCSREIGAVG